MQFVAKTGSEGVMLVELEQVAGVAGEVLVRLDGVAVVYCTGREFRVTKQNVESRGLTLVVE